MLLKQLAFAASAAAFLLVPAIPDDDEVLSALPIDTSPLESASVVVPQSEVVKLPTSEASYLELLVEVADEKRLVVNGFELYPNADPWSGDLLATTVVLDEPIRTDEVSLGYQLSVSPLFSDEFMELVSVSLRIIQFNDLLVNDVPTLTIELFKLNNDDKILMNTIEIIEQEVPEPAEPAPMTLADRVKAKFYRIWDKITGWAKCKHHQFKEENSGTIILEGEEVDAELYGEIDPELIAQWEAAEAETYYEEPSGHDWGNLIKSVAVNILVPVLAGITAGVGVAVLAMGICSLVAVVFAIRRRRCRRACRKSKAPITEPAIEEEKTGLMEDAQDAPPQYNDTTDN